MRSFVKLQASFSARWREDPGASGRKSEALMLGHEPGQDLQTARNSVENQSELIPVPARKPLTFSARRISQVKRSSLFSR